MRDWLFVDDHARALELVAIRGVPGESYNVGGGSERSNLVVVETICDLLDRMRPRRGGGSYRDLITFVSDRPGHDRRYAIDASKIERELGWQPAETFESGLAKTVRLVSRQRLVVEADPRRPICRGAAGLDDRGSPVRVLVTGREGQVALSLRECAAAHPEIELVSIGRPQLDLLEPNTVRSAILEAQA